MNIVQKKLLNYHHGYFMAIGLALALVGIVLQLIREPALLHPRYFQILTVLGALLLGWGTGRCDQKACETTN